MASFMKEFEHLEIKLEDIKSATNNFSENKVIGHGGFGKVYKGELSHHEGKSKVAVKRLDRKFGQGDHEFLIELRMLFIYKHKNLISLLGFCKEGDEMILIYEHASHGSLDRILNDATLTWKQRLNICHDAAKGLSFLHDPNGTQQRVLHRDIKSANILIDENLNAKVADFGLSKISPANQKYTFLFTRPVGTPGYCDPLYLDTYQLTKESDVYSFGVVLFEVLCGRVCSEYSSGEFKVFVNFWKECYEQKKLDEIIFPDIKHQLDPNSLETFVGIAYQCLQKSHEQRPTMHVVVEKLKAALELKELHDQKLQREHEQEEMYKAVEYEYKEILKAADPPLRFLEFPVNRGNTLLSINDKGEVFCERIYIEACLDQIQYDRLEDPSGFENSRFPGGRCYYKHREELEVRVRARFLYPQITYSVNLVFRNAGINMCKTLHYKLNGEAKCCMVYDTYKKEDGWFVVPLYQFTSDHKTADFDIDFKGFRDGCQLQVAGFEFQSLEENVELHDTGLEEYKDIVKAASQSMFYKSHEDLKELLSIGFHINNHKTWFSLNENGEHCEMLSVAQCLISHEGGSFYNTRDLYSRFPCYYCTRKKGFKVHIRTQFLTPSIKYTVNLAFCKGDPAQKLMYAGLKYKLERETETSIVYLATEMLDGYSFVAELYQFTSNGRTFDLEIVFLDHKEDLQLEGILFQPLEKVEHEQVLEDEELSNESLQRTVWSNLFKCFIGNGQEGYIPERSYVVDKDGKKCLMLAARGIIHSDNQYFTHFPNSRFREVAVITDSHFEIVKEIKSDVLSPETTYACYLVYKYTGDQAVLTTINPRSYVYLVSPPDTPIIGQKLDQITHNQPLNRPKLDYVPRQRSDGWMEVIVREITPRYYTTNVSIRFRTPDFSCINGLIIEGIELRPIVAHSA